MTLPICFYCFVNIAYILCPTDYLCKEHATINDNAFCIPMVHVCDGIRHCPSGEDERECGMSCFHSRIIGNVVFSAVYLFS